MFGARFGHVVPSVMEGSLEGLLIRPMSRGDIARVATIEACSQADPWPAERFVRELELPQARLTVAESAGGVVAYLCAWEVVGELEVQNVVTAPDWRRKGAAAQLLEETLSHARRQGLERLLLEVRRGNVGAQALYRRYGFRECGLRRGYYGDGEDALLMERPLADEWEP